MGSKIWLIIFSIILACSHAKRRLKKQANEIESDPEKHKELVLSIQEVNKTQFFEQDADKGEYQFGYQISPDGNFHHENRAPDGVTYGCYGYVDAYGIPVEYYYISDGWGYRTVMPNSPVEIFYHAHDPNSHSQNGVDGNHVEGNGNEGNHGEHQAHHEHHEHHGEIVQWNQLHFPKQCEKKGFTLPPSQSAGPSSPSQPSAGGGSGGLPGRPSSTRPSRPGSTDATFPARPQPQFPGQTIPVDYPGAASTTKKPAIPITGYPVRPEKPDLTGRPPSEYPGQTFPGRPSSPGVGYPQRPTPGFSGKPFPSQPTPTDSSVTVYPTQPQPGVSGQPSKPQGPGTIEDKFPGTSGTEYPAKPQPGFGTTFPSAYPRPTQSGASGSSVPQTPEAGYPGPASSVKPTGPETDGTAYSERPKPGFPGQGSTEYPQEFLPTQPARPGAPQGASTSYPDKPFPTQSPGTVPAPQPGIQLPGKPFPEKPESSEKPINTATQSVTEEYQPSTTAQPSKPGETFTPGTPATGLTQSQGSALPGQVPTTYPEEPQKPNASSSPTSPPGYPQRPRPEFPGQSPNGYPAPSRPETTGTGYPQSPDTTFPEQFPSGQPSQPTQPSFQGPSGYPQRPETTFPGQLPSGQPSRPTQPVPGSGTEYPQRPQTGHPGQRPSGLPGQPTQPTQPTLPGTSGAGYPQRPQTGYPGQRPSGQPGQPSQPPSAFPGQFPSGQPSQPTQPSFQGPSGSGYPQKPETTFPGQFPSGQPSQPTQPFLPGTSGAGYPQRPQTGYPGQRPSGQPGQPGQPGTGYPGQLPSGQPSQPTQPVPGFETEYPQKPETEFPGEFPSGPGQPSQPESTFPGQFPSGQPSQPTQPFLPGTSSAGYPGQLPSGQPGQASQPTQPTLPSISGAGYPGQLPSGQPGQPGQPSQPTQPTFQGPSGYPQRPETTFPGQLPSGQPSQPSLPDTSGTGYPQIPQTGYPGQRPSGQPGQSPLPTIPSGPGISGSGFPEKPETEVPGQLPSGQPSQPTQPSFQGPSGSGYPQKPETTFPGQPSQPTQPVPGSGTEYPQRPQTGYPGQSPSGPPGQPGQSSQPPSAFPGQFPSGQPSQPTQPFLPGTSSAGYPGQLPSGQPGQPSQPTQPTLPSTSGAGYPGQLPSGQPGQPGQPSQPTQPTFQGPSGYPQRPQTGYPGHPSEQPGQSPLPTLPSGPGISGATYPQPVLPSQPPTGYPGQAPESAQRPFPSTSGAIFPQKPGSSVNGQSPTGFPEQSPESAKPSEPGTPESEFPGQPEQPSLPTTSGSGYPQPELPGQLPTKYPGQPSVQFPRPGTAATGYPQKPQPGAGQQGSSGAPGQTHPSQVTSPGYPSSGFTPASSTAYPNFPESTPRPTGPGTYSPQTPTATDNLFPSSPEKPLKPVTSIDSSQKPLEPEYPTVGYFPKPSPSRPSFRPTPQGTTETETTETATQKQPWRPSAAGGYSTPSGVEESTDIPNFIEDKFPNCGGFQQPPCSTTEKETDFFGSSRPGGTTGSANCLCNPKDVQCMLDCFNSNRQTTKTPFEGSTQITTYRPTKPEKPTDIFCNCSPFDSECIQQCMETLDCDGTQGDCLPVDGNSGQPNYPTYPPPACGGPGQEDCPYPPAGIKPFPEFTYPAPPALTTTESAVTSHMAGCEDNEGGCQKPDLHFEITSKKPFAPDQATNEVSDTSKPPTYTPPSTSPPSTPTGMEFSTDLNQHFTESETGTSKKPDQGYRPVENPEREPSQPIRPTDSESPPGESFQTTGAKPGPEPPFQPEEKPEEPFQETEKPYVPTKPELPPEPFEPGETQPGYEGGFGKPLGSATTAPARPPQPAQSEKEPADVEGTGSEKPTGPEGENAPEEMIPASFPSYPGESQQPDARPPPTATGQETFKPGEPAFPFVPTSKPGSGFASTSQTETPELIHFKPSQQPQIPEEGSSSQFPSGEGSTDGSPGVPQHPDIVESQTTPKYPPQLPEVSGCESSSPNCAPPIYIIPYPVPIVPSPGNCPCYLVSPKNETSATTTMRPTPPSSTQQPFSEGFVPQGIIGYIPVVFYPYCPGNNTNFDVVQPYFPQAYPVPYPCQQCQRESNPQFTLRSSLVPQNVPSKPTRFSDPNLYPSLVGRYPNFVQEAKIVKGSPLRSQRKSRRRIYSKQEPRELNSFHQVLKQGNINSQQILRAPHRSSQFGERIRPIVKY